MIEKVNHPDHYNWIPGVECLDVIEYMSFNLGNAVKYIWRVGKKSGEEDITDLEKAVFYLNREIERISDE